MAAHQSQTIATPLVTVCLLGLLTIMAGCGNDNMANANLITASGELSGHISDWETTHSQRAANQTTALVNAMRQFTAAPSAATQATAQQRWRLAHQAFVKASVLDDSKTDSLRRIDGWPVAAGFFDDQPGYPQSGIVNDLILDMTSEMIVQQHQLTDDVEISMGFHVLEHYAFERPLTDFTPGGTNQQRRQRYIQLVSDLLLLDVMAFSHSKTEAADVGNAISDYASLVRQLESRSQRIFSESNLLGAHGGGAAESPLNLRLQLEAIAELMLPPVDLAHYLASLDAEKTATLQQIITEAISLLPENHSAAVSEANSSRTLLLISAISHQFEDLALLLPSVGEI